MSKQIRSIALITSMADTVVNFRGPLISALIARGIQVHALAPDYTDRLRQAVRELSAEPHDIALDRTGMHPIRDARDAWRLYRTLRGLQPDATLAYFIKPVIYGSLAARLARVRSRYAIVAGLGYVFGLEGGAEPIRRRVLRRLVRCLYRVAFHTCDCVFVQNRDDHAYLVSTGLIESKKVRRVNGSGVDLRALQPAPPVAEPVTFLLMARLLHEKGIREYVEAARLTKARCPSSRFIILGAFDPNPGGLAPEEVNAWVQEGVVEWPGYVVDVRPWIAQSSVYVLPSYYREGTPRSTQEAMAMGRPVITTDSVGCRETVVDGVNGFLVPVRDAASLHRAMMRFIAEPGLIAVMGGESRRLAEERFDAKIISESMLRAMGVDGLTQPEASSDRIRL
jgi:glycosyltransferase involved in cell wall biosynthesis